MADLAGDILQDIVSTLRAAGLFALVNLGPGGSESCVPRAAVIYEGQDALRPDDDSSARWIRLRAGVVVRTRAADGHEGVTRASELCDAATAALLADPYRGGRCHDLPAGRATEVDRLQVSAGIRRPEAEMSFQVRCHVEIPGLPAGNATSSLDGVDLFSSGPHSFRAGAVRRNLERRTLAGLDGELVLDLGVRGRPIVQTGRLQAADAAALDGLLAAIVAFVDGRRHTLIDNHGLCYPRVIVERFEPTTPIRSGRGFWCQYECQYTQLP